MVKSLINQKNKNQTNSESIGDISNSMKKMKSVESIAEISKTKKIMKSNEGMKSIKLHNQTDFAEQHLKSDLNQFAIALKRRRW